MVPMPFKLKRRLSMNSNPVAAEVTSRTSVIQPKSASSRRLQSSRPQFDSLKSWELSTNRLVAILCAVTDCAFIGAGTARPHSRNVLETSRLHPDPSYR